MFEEEKLLATKLGWKIQPWHTHDNGSDFYLERYDKNCERSCIFMSWGDKWIYDNRYFKYEVDNLLGILLIES